MKKFIPILILGLLFPSGAIAGSRSGYSRDVKCYKDVYREEYVPGTKESPGYVRRFTKKKEIPCKRKRPKYNQPSYHPRTNSSNVDDNSCIEGAILGGVVGGAAGGTLSTKENWIWSIPTGIVGGALIGCQVDGG